MATPTDTTSRARVIELMGALAAAEGPAPSRLDGVIVGRLSRPQARAPMMYDTGICFVLQGRKRAWFGDTSLAYDAQQFLVVSAPLSLECESTASAQEPLLALLLRIDLGVLAELLLALDDSHGIARAKPAGIVATPMTPELNDAVLRLLEALASPADARILGPAIVREIFYRVLTGEQGEHLRSALSHRGEFGQISRTLRRIHRDCAAPLNVATLAKEANMSVAAFYSKFKAVTSTSPMQYLKAIRLHQARLLMLQDGVGASVAASRVGYESATQFSREFKRLFQRTPSEEMAQLRGPASAPQQIGAAA